MADQTVVLTGQQAIVNQSTWGTDSQYGYGNWGTGGDILDVSAFNEAGWGSDTYGTENWGESGFAFTISGVSATTSVGDLVAYAEQGWGRDAYGEEPWGESYDPTISLSGFGLTSALGTPTVTTEINTGWGQDGLGVENWGESALTVIVDVESSGVATTGLPDTSWGAQGWGSSSDVGTAGST